MKISRAIFLLFIFCLTSAARGDVTLTQKIEGAGPVDIMVMKIKGDKARVEPNAKMTMIIDNKTGEMLNLMHEQKKFIRISSAQVQAVAGLAIGDDKDDDAASAKPALKATGRKETILGYEAQEYVTETPSFKATYWISTTYPGAKEITQQLQSVSNNVWKSAAKHMPDMRDFRGLPLRSVVTVNGKEITSTLVSAKQDSLGDDEFVVPKDYQEIKMPDMQSLMGGKPPGVKTKPPGAP
ncbi:MAG: DUF4412 domain-containing protein [Verrucomicrobiota bacterium]|nr:DUF4412 domain-containing protein [Verrucomicrobiota bacterium]